VLIGTPGKFAHACPAHSNNVKRGRASEASPSHSVMMESLQSEDDHNYLFWLQYIMELPDLNNDVLVSLPATCVSSDDENKRLANRFFTSTPCVISVIVNPIRFTRSKTVEGEWDEEQRPAVFLEGTFNDYGDISLFFNLFENDGFVHGVYLDKDMNRIQMSSELQEYYTFTCVHCALVFSPTKNVECMVDYTLSVALHFPWVFTQGCLEVYVRCFLTQYRLFISSVFLHDITPIRPPMKNFMSKFLHALQFSEKAGRTSLPSFLYGHVKRPERFNLSPGEFISFSQLFANASLYAMQTSADFLEFPQNPPHIVFVHLAPAVSER